LICPRCEKYFDTTDDLRRHRMVVHHDISTEKEEKLNARSAAEKVKRNRNCICPRCQEVFASRKQRHHHVMVHHRKTRLKFGLRPVQELYEET
jgi:uncharacterized C2H2 Zn-finger protein